MERIIVVTVKDKIATCSGVGYICGNSDYVIHFELDDEWAAFDVKTARFKWGKRYVDVVFSGNVCTVPVITSTELFSVGLFAGDLRTTTPAYIKATKSILCGDSVPADPPPDVYRQIIDELNALSLPVKTLTERVEALEKNGGGNNDDSDDEGTQPDWNQNDPTAQDHVKNRTHYVAKAFEDITWDGDTTGKVACVTTEQRVNWYKISDQIPTEADLLGATLIRFDGAIIEISEKDLKRVVDDLLICHTPHVHIASAPVTYRSETYPSAGVYFMGSPVLGHTHSLKAKEIVHKIDPKFVPDNIAKVDNAIVGQAVTVKSVDSEGKPTEWGTVNFPTDDHINGLINTALGVIENGSY